VNAEKYGINETKYLIGGHGEAIRAKRHPQLARFLLTGQPRAWTSEANVPHRRFLVRLQVLVVLGIVAVCMAYWITISYAPDSTWGVANGSLLTYLVIRVMMFL
jgi:hypothetical protein